MKRLFATTVAAALLALAGPAAGAEARDSGAPAPRTQVVDFDGAEIDGNRLDPGGAYVMVPPKARFRSLVKVRATFVPELARSADEL